MFRFTVQGYAKRDKDSAPEIMNHIIEYEADDEAVLFSFSDQVVQENLGIWREKKG